MTVDEALKYIISMGVVAPRLPGGVAALRRASRFRPAQRRHRSPTREIDRAGVLPAVGTLSPPPARPARPACPALATTVSTPENRLNRTDYCGRIDRRHLARRSR